MTWQLFLVTFIPALSCWLVARLFVIILFRPHRAVSVLGVRIRGIIPARQSQLASAIGKTVATQFFPMKMIGEKIADPASVRKIIPVIEEHVDHFLRNKLKKEMPFLSVFVGEKTINSLKKVFMAELESLFPTITGKFIADMANDLNIEQFIAEKIRAIPVSDVERAVKKNFSSELRIMQIAAFLLGLAAGILTLLAILYIK